MFGSWGTKDFEDMRVETPDGPGVIKGIHKNNVHVKLAKAPGRPRKYSKSQVRIIDTRGAEDVGAKVVSLLTPVPVPGVVEHGAKWVLKSIFRRMFTRKTGY